MVCLKLGVPIGITLQKIAEAKTLFPSEHVKTLTEIAMSCFIVHVFFKTLSEGLFPNLCAQMGSKASDFVSHVCYLFGFAQHVQIVGSPRFRTS